MHRRAAGSHADSLAHDLHGFVRRVAGMRTVVMPNAATSVLSGAVSFCEMEWKLGESAIFNVGSEASTNSALSGSPPRAARRGDLLPVGRDIEINAASARLQASACRLDYDARLGMQGPSG